MTVLVLTLSILASILALFSLIFSMWQVIELKAMKKSTHAVEYVPLKTQNIEDIIPDPMAGVDAVNQMYEGIE